MQLQQLSFFALISACELYEHLQLLLQLVFVFSIFFYELCGQPQPPSFVLLISFYEPFEQL